MDAYEATRVVLSRIQSLDPDNAHKIMGLLLLQEHGEQEMIRLAFGPESLLQSVLLKARKELGLMPQSSATGNYSAAPEAAASPFLLRQGSASRLLPATSPSSWAPPSVFSRSNSGISANGLSVSLDELQSSPDLVSPSNLGASPFNGGSDPVEEFLMAPNSFAPNPSVEDAIHPDIECRTPSGNANGMNWGTNGYCHRRSSSAADIFLGDSTAVLGWKPCLYFARGYCKNGTACRFLHGIPEEAGAAIAAGAKRDAVEQQLDLLLRCKSQRIAGASHHMAASFPCSPTGSVLPSPLSKPLNFWLQQQQNESQRATAALFLNSRMYRSDLITNPGSRQIYLTFPADSTFTEEDVSDYFSIYGPVQDVRIPYQQKRMFGFVTFVFPETVKLIFAKGNPHFVCNSRVLVKPYKEKGKVPDKYRRQPPPPQEEAYDLQQLGAKTLYSNGSASQEILLRKLEEQQAAELQQAIELQGRRFMGLQLLDLQNRSFYSAPASINSPTIAAAQSSSNVDNSSTSGTNSNSSEDTPTEEKSFGAAEPENANPSGSNPSEDVHFQESTKHTLPDSSFASATKSSLFELDVSLPNGEDTTSADIVNTNWNNNHTSTLMPITTSLGMPSFSSYFLHVPRSSFGHGAIGR